MNERIRELAERATTKISFRLDPNTYKHIDDPDGDLERFEFDKEKFAKLIVRECGQVLVDNTPVVDLVEDWDKGYDRAMNDCIHHIYEHFGVE